MKENDDFLQMYLDEMKDIPPLTESEEQALCEAVLKGDEKSRKRLAESYLKYASFIVSEYVGKGLSVQELIGEANLELTRAVSEYSGGNFKEYVTGRLKKSLQDAVEENSSIHVKQDKLADDVNQLIDFTKTFSDSFGREPTLKELSERLDMDEEHIRSLLKMSLDAVRWDNENDTGSLA